MLQIVKKRGKAVAERESKIKDGNFILIQSWMAKDLQLKGNALLIYAIIYGFSQAEDQVFNGSLQYLADWTNTTKQGVLNILKKLCEDDLIGKNERIINGIKFCEYYSKNLNGGIQKSLIPIQKSLIGGIQKSLTNNISLDNKENNILDNKKDAQQVQEPIDPPIIQLILNDKSLFDVTKEYFDEWCELYPNVDVMQELRNMKGWLNANPTKRKTKRGINKFINGWLAREQDKPKYNQPRKEPIPSYMTEEKSDQPEGLSNEAKMKALELQKEFNQVSQEEYDSLMNDIQNMMKS